MKTSLRPVLALMLPLCAAAGPCRPLVNIGSFDKADSAPPLDSGRVGAPCELAATLTPMQAGSSGQALECASRLCIEPAAATATPPVPLCTAGCGSDDDCLGGALSTTSGGGKCTTRFVCAVPFEVGPLACQRLCVCNDFLGLLAATPALAPASCGPTTLRCEFDVATQAYDRNCVYTTADAGMPDGTRRITLDPPEAGAP
jgi:hypothetical protein